MDWLDAPDYWLTRFVFERALGGIYLVAFLVAVNQFRPLLGERGLLPAPEFIRAVPFRASPTLFHLIGYSDRRLVVITWAGAALSVVATLGLLDGVGYTIPFASMAIFALLWILYLSIVNVGQTFYSFGWESLLLETGFLAIFLGAATTTPQFSLIVLMRWLLFRVEFGAGLIKMRGDRCWRDLTCLHYHHETQPMPNPLSWYFHHLPKRLHRMEVLGNHFAQLALEAADHERELRSVSHRRDLRRFRIGHQGAIRDRDRRDGRAGAHAPDGVARVRVQGKAWGHQASTAAGGAVPPAPRLADVVRGDVLTDVPRVVRAASREAAPS